MCLLFSSTRKKSQIHAKKLFTASRKTRTPIAGTITIGWYQDKVQFWFKLKPHRGFDVIVQSITDAIKYFHKYTKSMYLDLFPGSRIESQVWNTKRIVYAVSIDNAIPVLNTACICL